MNASPFFTLHKELPREGPGDAASLHRVAGVLSPGDDAVILDAGSGPGGDIATLLDLAPQGQVVAVDTHAEFVAEVERAWASDGRVRAEQVSMLEVAGRFDFIWCAGAVYFCGVETALMRWRELLAEGGGIGFSAPAFFIDAPSDAARAYWGNDPVDTWAEIEAQIARAGFFIRDAFVLPDAAWAAYHQPMRARIEKLRAGADASLTRVLDEGVAEIEEFAAIRHETGYGVFAVTCS